MSFSIPDPGADDAPQPIMARLIETCPEFALLRDAQADIAVFFRHEVKVRNGARVLGMLALPNWQGTLGPLAVWLLCEVHQAWPAYIMILDQAWWSDATARDREALVFHELMHHAQAVDKDGEPRFDPEGLPVWAIREHDITAFNAEVRRYGAWHDGIRDFLAAAGANRL